MANRQQIVNYIIRGSRARGLDPNAVLAVARVEGLGGGIGDQGTSFGPFQLHAGGALPRGISNPQAWAQSPAGLNYALNQIARVAGGRRGRDAIAQIVSRFERPANIPGEISRASGLYGGTPPVASGGLTAPSRGIPTPRANTRSGGITADQIALLNAGNAMFGLDPLPAIPSVPQIRKPKAAAPQPQQMRPGGKAPKLGGRSIKFLEHFAAPYGLQVTSTTGGKHVKDSYHYKGRAIDVAGAPNSMAATARAALSHPQDFTEMFYTGPGNPGFFIKNGRVYPNAKLDRSVASEHTNHVHLAR